MIRIAVYHENQETEKAIVNEIVEVLKELKIHGRVYAVKNFEAFIKGYINGFYKFEILFMDTNHPDAADFIKQRKGAGAECVLLDTPLEELADFMMVKPVAWLNTQSVKTEKLREIINSSMLYIKQRQESTFCIRTKSKCLRIPYIQILYFESKQHQVVVHTLKKMSLCSFSTTLDNVEKVLPNDRFFRCHQSFLVNNDNIKQLDRTNKNLILTNDGVINISKKHYPKVDEIFAKESAI